MDEIREGAWECVYTLAVPYPAPYAAMIKETLDVDKEIRPTLVRRWYEVCEGNDHTQELRVRFEAHTPQDLRTSVRSFFDFLILTTRTVRAFAV